MKPLSDRQRTLPAALARLVATCIIAAGTCGLAGVVLILVRRGSTPHDLAIYIPVEQPLRTPGAIIETALKGDAMGILQCAVLLLIAAPVLRVITALIVFLVERDWLYVVISAIVFAGLVLSFVGIVE